METLLAAVLVALVALAAFAAYGTAQNYLRDAMTISRLQADVGFALNHLSRNLCRATVIQFDAAANELDVTVPTIDSTGLIKPTTMAYWRQGAELRWAQDKTQKAAYQVLADHATAFTVAATGTAATVTLTCAAGTQTFTLTSTTVIRGRQE